MNVEIKKKILSFPSLSPNRSVKTLYPRIKNKDRCLISYVVPPFLTPPFNEFCINLHYGHSNIWESYKMATIWRDLGFIVDLISYENKTFLPEKKYSLFIDAHTNMERIAPHLSDDCLKILHITGAHWSFQNKAELNRIHDLERRKGILLTPRRLQTPNCAIELADCATIIGNQFTIDTYKFANKRLFPLPNSTTTEFPRFTLKKNFNRCKKNFLWLGNGGLIHKGLDLVLEAFLQLPDCHLSVCGPIKSEPDFENLYHSELYETKNITTYGWINLRGREFRNIINQTSGFIFPSCSEGSSGSVITCMHAGLIPIVSFESGVDIEDSGILLKKSSIGSIVEAVTEISSLTSKELEELSRRSWQYARDKYTRKAFTEKYIQFSENIIGYKKWH